MKIMLKKSLALVMMIFILSSCFAVFAAEEEAPVETPVLTEAQIEKYNEDLDFLKAVGIWTSPQTDPVLPVTRGEFASAIAGLCNLDVETNATLKYKDVTADALFVEDIYAVGIMNLMVGSDGMFRPEDKLTINQAVKTVVCALGYEAIANARGGYPNGYYSMAIELGLIVGKGRDVVMTRRDVVDIITRACFVEVMDIKGITADKLDFQINKKNDALAIYHSIYELKGLLTDDGLTNLKGATQYPGQGVIVGGKRLKNENVKTDGYMGANVLAYYNFEEDKLVYLKENTAKNNILTVKADDLVTDSEKFKKTNAVYRKDKKNEDIPISPYADFIYNGSSYPAFMVNDLKIKSGSLTFIDNDLDRTYDVVVAEEFVNYVLLSNNEALQLISDHNGNEIRYGEYDKFEFFDGATWETKPVSRLKSSSIISVYASKDNVRIKLVVSENKVEGTVSAIETDEDDNDIITVKYLVEGVETESSYEYSRTFIDNIKGNVSGFKKANLNDNVIVRLDFEGRIGYFENYKDQYQYAYFLKAGENTESKFSPKCLLKMVIPSGDIVTISTAKKIIINGASTENGKEVLEIADLYVDGNIGGEFLPQVVKVKISAMGELKEIETTNETENCVSPLGFDLTKFCKVFETASNGYSEYYNGKRMSFGGKYIMDENTAIYLIPQGEAFTEDDIRVVQPEDLYNDAPRAHVKMYDANELWVTKAVVVETLENYGYMRGSAFTVKKVQKGVNADGDDIYFLTGLYKNIDYTFREAKPGIIDAAIPGGPKFGDILNLKADSDFNIIGAKLVVRTSTATPFSEIQQGTLETGETVLYGHIMAKNDNIIALSTDYGNSMVATPVGSGLAPVVIDYRNKEIRVGTFAEIPAGASMDANGNFTLNGNDTLMYIYRYSGYISQSAVVIK